MSYEYYRYCANPPINFFPRALKDLFKEEKTTVNGVETIDKKCELKDILSTYEDGNNYTLAGKKFKKIENRIYIDLGELDTNTNEYTVTKKVCVGFLAKHDDTYDFMKAETKYYSLLLKCETDNNAFSSYLVYEDQNNSKDPSKPISINLNNSPYKIKELSIVVKYSATNIPDNAKLKIYATYSNVSGWSHTFTLDIYRNTENSLDGFKQSSGKDTDFFVLPRVNPSENQKECIRQLKIINNQVFSRNKKFGDTFKYVKETNNFIKNDGSFDNDSYNNLKNNIANSIDYFKADTTNLSKGCRSSNNIGDFKTVYNFNFLNYGSDNAFIEYLSDNYGISKNNLKGIILDRNFLLGSCVSQNPYAKYEGILNLYKEVVVPFINDFTNQLQSFLNHNIAYLSCPAYNENYHRGPLTINNITKYLYVGEGTSIKTLSSLFQGYTGNNILPQNAVIEFFQGKDEHCFNTTSENFYRVSSITIPNYGSKNFTKSDNIFIKLSYEDKKLCLDINNACNRGDYTSTTGVTDVRDVTGINNYNNYGLPYFMFGAMQKWNTGQNQISAKMTKAQLFSWSETKNNWYSYELKPNTEYFGIDCSGLVVNSLLSIKDDPDSVIKFYSTLSAGKELDVKATMLGTNDSRKITNSENFEGNSFLVAGDIVTTDTHIVVCNQGNLNGSFENLYVSKNSLNDNNRYFEVIHNYGDEYIRIKPDTNGIATKYNNLFCHKTISGPFKHCGNLKIQDENGTYSSDHRNALLGRIYLWN